MASMDKKVKFEQIHNDKKASFRYGNSLMPYQDEISLHFHPEIEITYIYKGAGYRMTGDFPEAFDQGDLVLAPSNLPHCWIYTPESCHPDGLRGCIFIQFLPELLEKGLSFFPEWEYAAHRLLTINQGMKIAGPTAQTVIFIMKEMSQQTTEDKMLALIRIIQLIGTSPDLVPIGLSSSSFNNITKSMRRMQTIYKYVLEHYKQKISLNDIAAAVSMTPTAFCSFFKDETGKTFNTFVNEYRIGIVCNLLKNFPDEDINLLAWQCGFNDVPYFNRAFKKMMNMTPGEWRKM